MSNNAQTLVELQALAKDRWVIIPAGRGYDGSRELHFAVEASAQRGHLQTRGAAADVRRWLKTQA